MINLFMVLHVQINTLNTAGAAVNTVFLSFLHVDIILNYYELIPVWDVSLLTRLT